jgi:hypothetical protein
MGDIIVISVPVIVVLSVVFSMLRSRKKGKGCACGCASCEKRFLCHPDSDGEAK